MECCVGVSTETVIQIVKFYTVSKKNLKTDVSDSSQTSSEQFFIYFRIMEIIEMYFHVDSVDRQLNWLQGENGQ